MASSAHGAALLEVARSLRLRIVAERDRIESARRLPEDLTRELARAGFFRIYLPAAYGGLDLTPMEAVEIFEELARGDASVAWCVWNGNTHWTAAQLSPEAARTVYANPDVVTANSTRPSGQAQVVDGGYHVTGRWSLVSGCELGTWMVLLCVIHDDDGPRPARSEAPQARFMLIPSSECEIVDTWTVGGLRGTGSHDVVACDVFVGLASTTRMSFQSRATAFRRFPASSPVSARWRWGSPEPPSRSSRSLRLTRHPSERHKGYARTAVPKLGFPRLSRWYARRGCFSSTAWIGSGPP